MSAEPGPWGPDADRVIAAELVRVTLGGRGPERPELTMLNARLALMGYGIDVFKAQIAAAFMPAVQQAADAMTAMAATFKRLLPPT